MTNATKPELLALADRVEASEALLNPTVAEAALGLSYDEAWRWEQANGHPLDSLDAAKALHDAVLPGWDYEVNYRVGTGTVVGLRATIAGRAVTGAHAKAAVAWVAAILRAKAGAV